MSARYTWTVSEETGWVQCQVKAKALDTKTRVVEGDKNMRRQELEIADSRACELASTCPYFEGLSDMLEEYREQYCQDEYQWCGRYMTYSAMEKERQIRFREG
jgi:hypothetical protein